MRQTEALNPLEGKLTLEYVKLQKGIFNGYQYWITQHC